MSKQKILEMPLITYMRKICRRYIPQEKNILDQRRQRFAAWYVLILTLGILTDLMEVSGSFDIFYKYTNCVMLFFVLLFGALYVVKKSNILRTVSLLAFTTQFFIALDTIYCVITPTVPHTQMVILVNTLILTANIMFSIATYQESVIIVNVITATTTFFVCMLSTNNNKFQQYLLMLALIFAYIGILGIHTTRISQRLQVDNNAIKRESEELLGLLCLDREELKLYAELAKKKCDEGETRAILTRFNEKTRKNVIGNVLKYTEAELYTKKQIEKVFPELTSSERDIVQLILKGYKLSGICNMLDKSESNVNTQRANIRRKLGLLPADNLNDVLHRRMQTNKG